LTNDLNGGSAEQKQQPQGKPQPDDQRRSAISMVVGGVFPEDWKFVPVQGKATFVKNWTEAPIDSNQALLDAYHKRPGYRGVGVLTGRHSQGLIAIDIDGPQADERFRQAVTALGGTYEALGEESTMSWSSGKPGRRQFLYLLPKWLWRQLDDFKTLILRMDGTWEAGQGDMARSEKGSEYEEVVLRFNSCQSVLPGSTHPSGGRYRFLNYNGGAVAPAPDWLKELVVPYQRPVAWLHPDELEELQGDLADTVIPPRQIRGWVFREDSRFRQLLLPRLDELVFRKDLFPQAWRERDGDRPQRLNFCPWHGGVSGTAFQYCPDDGVWHCKACNVGGDWLDFVQKIEKGDINADEPKGAVLEKLVADMATKLGLVYPDDAREEKPVKTAPLLTLTGPQFFEAVKRVVDSNENSELMHFQLMQLVRDCGMQWMYRNGAAVEMALDRYLRKARQCEDTYDELWQEKARNQRNYLIPDFVSAPSSVMLHARGGVGKTRVALALAKVVGRNLPIRIRGADVRPTQQGNVLLIGNDMSPVDYAEYLEAQGILTHQGDRWLKFHSDWQQDEYKRLVRWLKKYQPVMVIIDSLTSCSTEIEAKENEKEYSNTMYKLARENGIEFPPTVFLWVHHNTKDGSSFRGTDTLRNAVHETWELFEPEEDEEHQYPEGSLILQVDKSRSNRSRARFLVEESIDEVLSIADLTPAVEHTNRGQGAAKPATVLLGVLGESAEPMTVKELKYALDARLSGERGEGVCVACKTVQRWVDRWVSRGLVVKAGMRQTGGDGGRPAATFSRVSNPGEGDLCPKPPVFFENPCSAREEVLDTEMSKTHPEDEVSKTPESGLTETNETTSGAPEIDFHGSSAERNSSAVTPPPVTPPEHDPAASAADAAPAEEFWTPEVLDKRVSKTPEPETPVKTGDLGDASEFWTSEGLVRGRPVPERDREHPPRAWSGPEIVLPETSFDEDFPD
jgi:hypothetical protein